MRASAIVTPDRRAPHWLTRRSGLMLTLGCLVVLALGVGYAGAQETDGGISLQAADTSEFPEVSMRVTVPAAVLSTDGDPQFTVTENGREAEILEVVRSAVAPETGGVDVVLAIDTSGSMDGASMTAAKQAAREFVSSLQPGNRVAVVSFSTSAVTDVGFTDDAGQLTSAIQALEARGETAVYDALVSAAVLAKSGGSASTIVVLSDGGDTVSRSTLDDAVRSVRDAGVPVYSVALPSYEADPAALRTISSQSGGRLLAPGDLDELTDVYRGLAEEIQDSFTISYVSARPSTKDLEVAVSAASASGQASGVFVLDNPRFAEIERATEPVLPAAAPADVLSLSVAIFLVFGSVALLAAGVALIVMRPRTALDQVRYYEQLQGVSGELPDSDSADPDGLRTRMVDAVDYVASRRGFTGMIRERLERAGLPLRAAEYIGLHLALVVALGVGVQMVAGQFALSVLTIFIATFGPLVWLDWRASARTKAFEEQLPEILNLVAGSLRAGWGMLQAIDLVVQETLPPASDEFKRVQTEARLGLPVEEALRAMAERLGSDDFRWAVAAIAIQREVGGNLAEVLDVVAGTIRDRAGLRRQVRALTAEGRLSAGILIGLPFFEFAVLMIVNPTYMSRLFTTSSGLVMAALGGVLLIIGAFWLRKAMAVEV